jgi:hypothetical protein
LINLIRLYECTPVSPRGKLEGFAMEPLSISMTALVELLKEDRTEIPIEFARKTARGLTEGIRYMHEEMSLIYAGESRSDLTPCPLCSSLLALN